MRSGRWKLWAGIAVAVLLVASFVARQRRSIEVDTVVVARGVLTVTIDEAATTRVRDRVDIAAPVTGRFVPTGIRVGDAVDRGTLLGTISSAPLDPVTAEQARQRVAGLTAALAAARARVDAAQSAAAIATRDAERAQRLFDAGAIAQRGLDEAKAASTAASNELAAARENVHQVDAERAGAQAVVTASETRSDAAVPVAATRKGRVLRLFLESPRVVPAGTPLAQIGDVSELEAVIPILSADAPGVRAGAAVRFALGSSLDTLTGAVALVEPAAYTKYSALGVEEQRVNVIASVNDSAGRLGDQYRLDARITVWEGDVLKVPTSALVRDGDAWSVFVVREGRAATTRVRLGERAAEWAEVREGLSVGDRVILYPAEDIADGTRVRERGGS